MQKKLPAIFLIFMLVGIDLYARDGLLPAFEIQSNEFTLQRLARPGTPFDKVGRQFAILGEESGSFEAWAYPLKLFRDFRFSFFLKNSTRPIMARDIVHHISVAPAATVITYVHQSFTVKAIFVTPVREPGALIFLDVDSTVPLTIVCGFLPVLQPMWPAGIGGQYALWDDQLSAYVISEPTRRNHGMVGSPAGVGISSTPAHMLAESPNEFQIDIPDPGKLKEKYIPVVMAGRIGSRDSVIAVYRRLLNEPEKYYMQTVGHYRRLHNNTLRIKTPNPRLNTAFEWAKIALDNLVVENPNLGKGLVAGLGPSGTSGRPGFGWYFGGDAYYNCLSLNSYGAYSTVKDALSFTQKWQREDGKMAHELSQAQGYVDWWNDYHYGYIHGDTTPQYLIAMYDYYKMTGDAGFIRKSWNSLKKAYEWCLSTDVNGDGLMDNKQAGLGATEYGAFTGIETDIFLASVWVQAARSMQKLAEAAGESEFARNVAQDFREAKQAFDEKFWDDQMRFYTFGFNASGETVQEITPWSAFGLMWDIGDPERSLQTMEKINSSDISTDWGCRTVSIKSDHYNPVGYNYGAVWPWVTGFVNTAQFKQHLPQQGYQTLLATIQHTFDDALGYIPEVFSGTHHIWLDESVPHQGFSSAGAVLPLVRGLLGLDGNAVQKTVRFAPHVPAHWKTLSVEKYQIGGAVFAFRYRREKDGLTLEVNSTNAGDYRLTFAPALGIGTRINRVVVDGKADSFLVQESRQVIQPVVTTPLKDEQIVVEMAFESAVELLSPGIDSQIGDRNHGLRIISIRQKENRLMATLEGLSGEEYLLPVLNPEKITGLQGGALKSDSLTVRFLPTSPGKFVRHQLILETK